MKHIHFIGIKGVGMSPLAIIAKEVGFVVSGCDSGESFITDTALNNAQITVSQGFDSSHIQGVDLVITTGAHGGLNNPEVIAAKEKGIDVWLQGQAVGQFMKGEIFGKRFVGISISGCHGKTTTTAMVATLFQNAGLEPSFIIGTSNIPSLVSPGHLGTGNIFIAEADEYATDPVLDKTPKFLWQHPKILVINNIEYDHPDIYNNLGEVEDAYKKFTQNISEDGILVINGDDENCQKIINKYTKNIITFGLNSSNNYVLSNIAYTSSGISFDVNKNRTLFGNFSINAIGHHNGLNALAAIIVGDLVGIDVENIRKGLLAFVGTKRRLEYVGQLQSGAFLYDDYAHHPTEIQKTLFALQTKYPDKKIICIFQPHTYSRTKKLFDQFIDAFNRIYQVILVDIFASKREAIDTKVSSQQLVEKIAKKYGNAHFVPNLPAVVEYINAQNFGIDTILVTMGAGDIYTISTFLPMA